VRIMGTAERAEAYRKRNAHANPAADSSRGFGRGGGSRKTQRAAQLWGAERPGKPGLAPFVVPAAPGTALKAVSSMNVPPEV
jgi:hypothetical protein